VNHIAGFAPFSPVIEHVFPVFPAISRGFWTSNPNGFSRSWLKVVKAKTEDFDQISGPFSGFLPDFRGNSGKK
jgi:hypothetical protein